MHAKKAGPTRALLSILLSFGIFIALSNKRYSQFYYHLPSGDYFLGKRQCNTDKCRSVRLYPRVVTVGIKMIEIFVE